MRGTDIKYVEFDHSRGHAQQSRVAHSSTFINNRLVPPPNQTCRWRRTHIGLCVLLAVGARGVYTCPIEVRLISIRHQRRQYLREPDHHKECFAAIPFVATLPLVTFT